MCIANTNWKLENLFFTLRFMKKSINLCSYTVLRTREQDYVRNVLPRCPYPEMNIALTHTTKVSRCDNFFSNFSRCLVRFFIIFHVLNCIISLVLPCTVRSHALYSLIAEWMPIIPPYNAIHSKPTKIDFLLFSSFIPTFLPLSSRWVPYFPLLHPVNDSMKWVSSQSTPFFWIQSQSLVIVFSNYVSPVIVKIIIKTFVIQIRLVFEE